MFWVSQVALVVKNQSDSAGDLRDVGSISGSGRSPGGGHGIPLQYSYLENLMDRGAWQSTVQGATKSRSRPKGLGVHALGVLPCENMRFLISTIPEDILSTDMLQGQNLPTSGGKFCLQVRVINPVLRDVTAQFSSVQFSRSVVSDSL